MTAAGDRRGGDALAQAFDAARRLPRAPASTWRTAGPVPAHPRRAAGSGRRVRGRSFTVEGGRIVAIDVVRNPDKLTGVREPG
jgi:hypothetical protein